MKSSSKRCKDPNNSDVILKKKFFSFFFLNLLLLFAKNYWKLIEKYIMKIEKKKKGKRSFLLYAKILSFLDWSRNSKFAYLFKRFFASHSLKSHRSTFVIFIVERGLLPSHALKTHRCTLVNVLRKKFIFDVIDYRVFLSTHTLQIYTQDVLD